MTAAPTNIALSESGIRMSLAEMLATIPARSQPSSDTIDTRHLIASLARQWPYADDASYRILDQFAKRLAINKQLDESYTLGWRREPRPRELPALDHFFAAVLLLAFSFVQDGGVDDRGKSLYLVNGALFARDRSAGVPPRELALFDSLRAHLIAGRIHHG